MSKKYDRMREEQKAPPFGASEESSRLEKLAREAKSFLTDAQHKLTHDRNCEKLIKREK